MVKNHLKRLSAPNSWKIQRKRSVWITRPLPSGHKLADNMSISTILKEVLGHAQTTGEVKVLLRTHEITVNGRRLTDHKAAVGLWDVLAIPKLNEYYRMMIGTRGTLVLLSIPKKEADTKIARVLGKKTLSKNTAQLNLTGGWNILVKKDTYAVGGSVLVSLPGQEIKEFIPLEEGSAIYLTGGKHVGTHGTLKERKGDDIVFAPAGEKGETMVTSVDYAFAIGKGKPAITIEEGGK